jgi:hypothetical protein
MAFASGFSSSWNEADLKQAGAILVSPDLGLKASKDCLEKVARCFPYFDSERVFAMLLRERLELGCRGS